MNYFYIGDTIDPFLNAKVEIPSAARDEFLKNQIFAEANRTNSASSSTRSWWNASAMTNAVHADNSGNPAIYVGIGEEGGKLVAYISWHTM